MMHMGRLLAGLNPATEKRASRRLAELLGLVLARAAGRGVFVPGPPPAPAAADLRERCLRLAALADELAAAEAAWRALLDRHAAALAQLHAQDLDRLDPRSADDGVNDALAAAPLLAGVYAARLGETMAGLRAARGSWRRERRQALNRLRRALLARHACGQRLRDPNAVLAAWNAAALVVGPGPELQERLIAAAQLEPDDAKCLADLVGRARRRAERLAAIGAAARRRALIVRSAVAALAVALIVGAVTWVAHTLYVRKRIYGRIFLPRGEQVVKPGEQKPAPTTEQIQADKTLDKQDDFLVH